MLHKRFLSILFIAAVMLIAYSPFTATANAKEQSFHISTADTLKSKGATATSAATETPAVPALPQVIVQMEFTVPITELIELRGLNEKGEELIRSKTVRLIAKKAGTHPVVFAFAEGSTIESVALFEVEDVAEPTGKKTESGVFDEAKHIIEHIFE